MPNIWVFDGFLALFGVIQIVGVFSLFGPNSLGLIFSKIRFGIIVSSLNWRTFSTYISIKSL